MKLPTINPELSKEERMEDLDNTKLQLEHEISVIKEAVETLQGCNKDWGDMMERLAPKKKEEEEMLYEDYSTGENSIFKTITKGIKTVKVFEARIKEAELMQLRLWNHQQIGIKEEPSKTEEVTIHHGSTSKWVNLPKLELPAYDGDPLKWSGFWDTFEATVHTQAISPVQKLNYLMSKLTGEAFEALDGITKSNDNYEIAVELLKERFGQARQIKQALYAQLRNIPKASEKTEELRRTLTGVDRVARQLKAMGEDLNQDSLVTQVLEKLPDDIVLEVGKGKSRHDAWEMARLRAALEDIVCNREDLLRIKKYLKPEDQKATQSFKQRQQMHAVTDAFGIVMEEEEPNEEEEAVMALTSESKKSGKPLPRGGRLYPCAFCGENHYNDLCVKYNTLGTRQGRVKEKELCFRCLRPGHVTAECRFTRPCPYCQGNHNRALCARYLQPAINNPFSEQTTTRMTATMGVHTMIEKIKPEKYEEMEGKRMMKTHTVAQGKQQAVQTQHEVALLTAKTEVSNPDERDKVQIAHIFFDSGSERSFITKQLAKKLKLNVESKETLSISTFASKEPQKVEVSLVEIGITLKDGTTKIIQASALEMLTNELQRKALKQEDLQIFEKIPLDDFADGLPSKYEAIVPDILIGSDYFWEFMEQKERIKCPSGLYLIPSKVGLLIGGKQGTRKTKEEVKTSTLLTSTNEEWKFNQKSENAKPSLTTIDEIETLESTEVKDTSELSDGGARQDDTTNAGSTKEIQEDATNRKVKDLTKTKENDKIIGKKKSTKLFYFMYVLMIIHGFTLTGAKGNPCPEDAHLDKIESQKCVKEGIVIMRTEQGYLCWIKKKCPLGHLGDDGACGPLCACPTWAEECSYHDGPPPTTSGDQVSILNLAKPSACSFEPDARCNEKPTHTRLHQIQLYDGSLHYVKNLELRRAQATTEDYECQGEGQQVGTPEFCENHECAKNGARFCYYRNNEIVFFINEDGEIPIKAWGSVPVTLYGPKEIPAENPSCLKCTLKCVQGGIEIITDEKMGLIEVCSKPYCYRVSHPKRTEVVLFPKDIVINTHEVTVKIWSNGYLIKDLGVWCDASPYCEMIDCYLCWNLIGNPQCAPKWMFFIISLMLYFGSVTLYVIIKLIKYLFQCCYYSTHFTWQCLHCCRMVCRRARSKTYEKMYLPVYSMLQEEATENQEEEQEQEMKLLIKKTNRPRNNKTFTPSTRIAILSIVTTITLIANQVKMTEACAEVTTLTAQQSMCTMQENGMMECILTEATRLALVPQGQDSCLLIKDPNGQPIGTLSIEVEKAALECQVKNEYFTRSFTMKVVSSKRCPGSGSCKGERCGEVKIDTKVNELGEEANNSPGFTYCTESCGCISCGCFHCFSGCLFYRTYASPTSDITYEVFSCPVWEYKVKSTIRLNSQDENVQQAFEMKPGVAVTWKNIKLTLISITSPPVPILGSQFLTDGTRTIIVKASESSQPVAGTVGEMQCANREKAEKFDCYLPHDACTCQGQETRVSCHCVERTIEDIFSKTEYVLPLTTFGLALTGTGKKIEAEYNQIASLELQISMEGLRLSTKTDKNKCQIKPLEMAGCYNCLTGAKLNFECKTDFGEALAHVTCGEGTFSTVCTPQGIKATATMNFQHAVVKEECTVVCPAGSTTFSIDTTLVFIEKERLGQLSNTISTSNDKNELDFGFLSAWLSGNWLASISLIAAVAVGILLSVILFPVIMQVLISCATKTSVVLMTRIAGKKQRHSFKEL
uniref:CCHC-type domain-containing protein n=1 Tax=Plectus sambesii TaxID=2011161 RepID=A0A914X636_9BILA